MSQIAQQVVTPVVIDPNHVAETFVDGPVNVNISGPNLTFTFTVARPDLDQAMKGQPVTKMNAVVTCRLTMPLHVVAQLRGTLNTIIQDQPQPGLGTIVPGSNRPQ